MIDKSKYESIEIPEILSSVVDDAIDEGLAARRSSRIADTLRKISAVAAMFFVCFVILLNTSPVFAETAGELSVIGDLCRIFTFREYHFQDATKYVSVEIPKIDSTGKTDLERRVNLEIQKTISDRLAEFEARAKEYYEAYLDTGGNPDDFTPLELTIEYEIKHIGLEYVSFVILQFEGYPSAYNYDFYYNIDVQNGRALTLRDLLGSDYRRIAAESMEAVAAGWDAETRALLWQDVSYEDLLSENTDFYLNNNGQIVIVIPKYEAACGAAGTLEFTLPADIFSIPSTP